MSSLLPLFRPRRIAVIGASRGGPKLGSVMARSLETYLGGSVLVNERTADPADGVYRSVAEAVAASGRAIDLAILCVPAAVTATSLRDAAAAGVRAAVVCAGGFAEAGGPGVGYQRDVDRAVADTGIRILGPNTSGFFVPGIGLTATFVPGADRIPAGAVAVVAASGGVNHALCFMLAAAGVGVSLGVGLGNSVDIDAPDVLDFLADDPATSAVALHVESVHNGPALLASVARLSERKPVVALVVGQTDVGAFAASHTGALATSWRTTRAVLRQAGAVVVDDDRALIDAVVALSTQRLAPHAKPGVGLITGQAGPGLLILDALKTAGSAVPELTVESQLRLAELLPPLTFQANPIDTGRPGSTFSEVLRVVAADPGVDVVAIYGLTEPDVIDLQSAASVAGLPATTPTVIGTGGPQEEVAKVVEASRATGIPVLTTPSALARSVNALVQDAVIRSRRQARPQHQPRNWATNGPWDEDEAKTLLDCWGITTPDRVRCRTRADGEAAMQRLTPPFAVKILDATIMHKTEVGGVHLNVRTRDQLCSALEALEALESSCATEYLIESMAPSGVDLIVGVRRDEVFGPVVLLGLGGTAAEAYGDVAIRSLPAAPAEIEAMVDDLQGAALMDGWRGGPRLDRLHLVTVITALSDALLSAPDVADIEINPLRLTTSGLIALDAVIIKNGSEAAHAPTTR
jgi:acyl-CoA synthetase (NDP forming)